MTFKFKVAAVALAVSAVGSAQAQKAPEPGFTISPYVALLSDYRFRGIEQTSGAPALQAGVDFTLKNGFYAGVFTSNVKWIQDMNGATSGTREVDYFGGYKTQISSDLTLDIGAIRYSYPDNNSGGAGSRNVGGYSNADTTEYYLGLSYGSMSFKYSQSIGDFLGNLQSNASRYYDFSFNYDLGDGFTFVPHLGYQTIPNQSSGADIGNAANYFDAALTLNKDFGNGWSVLASAIGTTAKQGGFYQTVPALNPDRVNRNLASSTVVFGLKYAF